MSFPRHAKYMDSGVEWLGQIPSHWAVKRLRFVAELNPSKSEVSHLAADTEVSFLPMEAIGEDGSLELDRVRPLADVQTGYTFFRDGDVTIAKITPCFENGKGAAMQGLCNGIGFGTTELIVTRPKASQTTSTYLHWLFTSRPFRKAGEAFMYGAGGQKRVPDDFVRDFAIGFPPVPEQRYIVTFLDREAAKIDALVEEQRRLIELLKEKRQAVISQAVTKGLNPNVPMKDSGVAWLGKVPAHWEVGPLKRFWSVSDCKHITAEFVEDGIPLASIREVQGWTVNLSEAKRTTEYFYAQLIEGGRKPQADDIIFTRNATVGEAALVPKDPPTFAMGQDVCLLRRNRSDYAADFMLHLIKSAVIKTQLNEVMIGSTFKRVNVEEIRSFLVCMPPAVEQREIAMQITAAANSVGQLIEEAAKASLLLQERRSALISAAITGKIDVRGLASRSNTVAA